MSAAPSSAQKILPTTTATTTATSGKIPFHGSTGSSPQTTTGLQTVKKPSISRGVPPPVPPNKPVVPPKKEAAYLRRTETTQIAQESNKFAKQNTNTNATQPQPQPSTASNAQSQQQTVTSTSHTADEEVRRFSIIF